MWPNEKGSQKISAAGERKALLNPKTDVVIIGAGASGLMCAMEAGKRGRRVMVLDHGKTPGRKILISGGGRCNFTNLNIEAARYISNNTHFCKSALSRYTQWDFIELVNKHGIAYGQRSHGQLFCIESARQILDMLWSECQMAGVAFSLDTKIETIERRSRPGFRGAHQPGELHLPVPGDRHGRVMHDGGRGQPAGL